MSKYISYFATSLFLSLVCTRAIAEVIDPETYIMKNGYHSVMTGDDGQTRSYVFTEKAASARIAALESEITKLPKHVEVQRFCDLMRGATKAKLIKQRGIAIDVAVTNYGYNGSTVVCVLKFMYENNIATQLIYNKEGNGGLYRVIVSE
ncbi:hypothetical protein [Methylobacter svalbardensis]|uniref:hypothetical protein n=1 Tax=Methylobacter svalbardensis TaxID=3080016 RepID=UPI0030EDACE5